MHLYYAHSIRWTHIDGEWTAIEVLDYLHSLGHTVSSEEFYTQQNGNMSDTEIFSRDISMIQQSDLILANVTNPSLGVGYELGYAESLGKPIVCFYQSSLVSYVSAMVTWNPSFYTNGISNIQELDALITSK